MNYLKIICVLSFVVAQNNAANIETVTDQQLEEIISQNEYVLALFEREPCTNEDCELALYETSQVANSSYIAGLKVVRVVNSMLTEKHSLGIHSRLIFFRKTVPALFDSFVIRMDDVVMWLEQNKDRNTQQLDSANFEHLTQASTGATTGDWFILFQEPSCNHLLPIWESVAGQLKHRINLAVVDVSTSPELKTRLRVDKCPSVIYFRLGRMYMYELSTHDPKSFMNFADGWYTNAPSSAVPKDPTPFDVLTDKIVIWLKTNRLEVFLNQTSFFIAVGLSTLALVCFCFLRRPSKKATSPKSD